MQGMVAMIRTATIVAIAVLLGGCSGEGAHDDASMSDAHQDGGDAQYSFDAGFSCGADSCTVGVSYCQTNIPSMQLQGTCTCTSCVSLPAACTRTPTCACLGYLEGQNGSCTCSDVNGFVEVTCWPV